MLARLTNDSRHTAAICMAALSGALVLGGYAFTRNASTALFLHAFGAASMPYNMAVVPIVMGVAAWLFNKTLSRFGSCKALLLSFGVFGVLLSAALARIMSDSRTAIAVFDILVQVFVVVQVEQHWSFLNSIMTPDQARRYNGPILTVFSSGPMIAGGLTGLWAEKIGSVAIMMIGLGMIVPSAVLMGAAYKMIGNSGLPERERIDVSGQEAGKHKDFLYNFALIRKTRILWLLALLTLCSQMLAATVACNYNYVLESAVSTRDHMTAFLGTVWMYSNFVTLLFQLFLTPFLLRRFSQRSILMAVPLLNFAFMLVFAAHPTLWFAAFAYAAYKCLDYAMFKAAKEIFYIPQDFDVRYRVKQIIDSLIYRFSNGVAALGLIVLIPFGSRLGVSIFIPVSLATALAWFLVSRQLPSAGERSD